METHASHLGPFFLWRSPLLRRMTRLPAHRYHGTGPGAYSCHSWFAWLHHCHRTHRAACWPWPLAHSAETSVPCIRALDPANSGAWTLLNQGQWTHAADTRDLAAAAPGLIPFVVHEAKCTQAMQRDSGAHQRAKQPTLLFLGSHRLLS